eukprot:3761946-Amphidinium_carterae.1
MTRKSPFPHSRTWNRLLKRTVKRKPFQREWVANNFSQCGVNRLSLVQREIFLVRQNSFRLGPVLLAHLALRNQAKRVQRR